MKENYTVKTLEELSSLSKKILEDYPDKRIFIFHGDLGSGKTSLIKELIKNLHIQDEVSSPTFSIVNEYIKDDSPIYHFDLYRINDFEELEEIGFFEYLDSGNYIFIEWPELIEDYIDLPYIEINMDILEDNNRNVIILEH
jgi:tRNA threonylcarbamoyladenosine biosynthesis protein TsaE